MPAPPNPLAVFEQLFGPAVAQGFGIAAAYHRLRATDTEQRLERAAEEAAWWGTAESNFEAFLHRYEGVMRSVCEGWRIGDRDLAMSRCRTSIYRTWCGVGGGSKARPLPVPFGKGDPYVGLVAEYGKRSCHEQWRAEHKKSALTSVSDRNEDGDERMELPDEPSFVGDSLDRRAEHWVLRLALMSAFQSLPKAERDVVMIRWTGIFDWGEKVPSDAIAAALGKTNGAVDMAYHHAKERLLALGIDLKAAEARLCEGGLSVDQPTRRRTS